MSNGSLLDVLPVRYQASAARPQQHLYSNVMNGLVRAFGNEASITKGYAEAYNVFYADQLLQMRPYLLVTIKLVDLSINYIFFFFDRHISFVTLVVLC